MSNVIRKMKILKNILKINARNTSKMKNAFDGFISRLNTAKERFTESEDMSMSSKTEKKIEKKRIKKIRTECPRTVRQLQKVQHMLIRHSRRRSKKK